MEIIINKRCRTCNTVKPIGDFHKCKTLKDGHQYHCKPCRNAKMREYRRGFYGDPKNCRARRKYERIQRGSEAWRERRKGYRQKEKQQLKAAVFAILGDVCALCGDSHKRALSVDHINGGGKWHYKIRGGGDGVYRDIIKDPDPHGKFRILCMKCNWLRRYESDEEIIARYAPKK